MKINKRRFGGNKSVKLFFSFLIIFCSFALILAALKSVKAEDLFVIDKIPAERPTAYSVSSPDGLLKMVAPRGTSTADLSYKLISMWTKEAVSDHYNVGDKLIPAGDLYYLEIATDSAEVLQNLKLSVILKYKNNNKSYNIYYWDAATESFVKLSSIKDLKKYNISAPMTISGGITFGLFEDPPAEGHASWYVHPRYPKELMAASTQFPAGSKVKVTNLDNNKSIVVTIKDWGPDPAVHPDRVIDLGKVAFQKIASIRAGVINVRVEPYIVSTSTVILTAAK